MNLRKIVVALVFIALGVVVVSLLWRESLLLTLVLIGLAFIKQKASPIKGALVWFVITAILGPTMESLIIRLGGNPWTYSSPFMFNVPIWLFPLYGLANDFDNTLSGSVSGQIDKALTGGRLVCLDSSFISSHLLLMDSI